jgi:hypothetical protein
MGEPTTLRASFRASLRIQAREDSLSSFGGVAYVREFEERTRALSPLIERLHDPRMASRRTHSVGALLRLAVYGRVLGFPDVTDADHLRFDPVLRSVIGTGSQDRVGAPLASKSTFHRFLTDTLCERRNRRALAQSLLESAVRPLLERGCPRRVFVDVDSTEIVAHGEQQGACRNGYFRSHCFHPLVVSLGEEGTILGFRMRSGNVHTSKHVTSFLLPLLLRLRALLGQGVDVVLRADSGFGVPHLLEMLERHGFHYVVRMRENARILSKVERLLRRRPSKRRFRHLSFRYATTGWPCSRRVVARAERAPGTLFNAWALLVTNLRSKRRSVVRAYLRRGQSEQVNDVFKNELRGDLMSHHRMRHNQVRGVLTALAQNLMVAFDQATRGRRQPRRIATLRAKLLLVATTIVRHARSLWLRLSAIGSRRRAFDRLARLVASCGPPRPATA